ncbi:hypothetical protein C8J56DRAFT_969946 [Mycena floridula]|nr:hypothetical protein C8J56DRAFT_969946 [Mycena floridula]
MHSYIEAYIGVQYNAVIDLAGTGNNNVYGNIWTGPAPVTYSPGPQNTAIAVLLSGVSIPAKQTTTSTSAIHMTTATTLSPSPKQSAKSPAGAIAGGIVGGLALVALLALWGIFLWRRKRLNQSTSDSVLPTPMIICPVLVQRSATTIIPSSSPTLTYHYTEHTESSLPSSPSTAPLKPGRQFNMPQSPPVAQTSQTHLPTEELIRLLNERLQGGQHHNVDEMPPEYSSSSGI